MNWHHVFEEELKDVFAQAETAVSRFPEPMDRLGLDYLAKFDPNRKDSTKNYICYLLPFWVSDLAELPANSVSKLALANVFVMLYFFIQDDIMDSASGQHKEKLPLGNLFYLQFLDIYRELFPSDSPFWTWFDRYVREWSDAVSNELRRNDFIHDMLKVAAKASPVQFASTGAMVLAGRPELIAAVSEAVCQVLVTLQMADDWADWQEDLEEGSYNCLHAMIREELRLPPDSALTAEIVKRQVYVHDALARYAQIAAANHVRLEELQLNAPHLLSFHESMVRNLLEEADRIECGRKSLELGGFNYYLSNMK